MYFLECFASFFSEVVILGLFGWIAALGICFWSVLVIFQLVSSSRRPR